MGTGGSGGSDGKTTTASFNDSIGGPGTPNGDPTFPDNPKDGYEGMGSGPITIDGKPLAESYGPEKKTKARHKTKKATAAANTADILEILKWTGFLTAIQLQKVSRVRRDRFLPLLKKLVKQGKIDRTGTGKRGNPYFYRLPKNA